MSASFWTLSARIRPRDSAKILTTPECFRPVTKKKQNFVTFSISHVEQRLALKSFEKKRCGFALLSFFAAVYTFRKTENCKIAFLRLFLTQKVDSCGLVAGAVLLRDVRKQYLLLGGKNDATELVFLLEGLTVSSVQGPYSSALRSYYWGGRRGGRCGMLN